MTIQDSRILFVLKRRISRSTSETETRLSAFHIIVGSGMAVETVLVVEDEVLVRMSIVEQLEERGFRVLEASHAGAAIEIMEQRDDIRLVFTDVDMPGSMDGLELAHYIRERWPPTAIVICSGNRPPAPEALPANSYWLGKPFEPHTMAAALETAKRWLTS